MEVDPPENENILNRVGYGVSSILSASFNAPSPVIKSLLQLRNAGACPNSNSIKEAEKEIKSLSKKVKPGLLQELEHAISSQNVLSKCVTVPRSLDGRQQNREKPHILLCRYWRYPMLQPHDQLNSLSHCMYGCQLQLEEICINPFHYELENVLPMVYVPKNAMGMMGSTSMLPENSGSFRNFRYHGGGNSFRDDLCNGIGNILPNNVELPNYCDNPMMPPGNYVSPPISDDGMMIGQSGVNNCGMTDMQFLPSPEIPINGSAYHHVPYEEPESWCAVSYYEKSTRVGEMFHGRKRVLTVDGGTDPSNGERFCIGQFFNNFREPAVEDCRRHIGRGVKFTYCDGEVVAECLNDRYSIFVQSAMSNLHLGWEKSTVVKVFPDYKLTIFNNKEFADLLLQTVPKGYEAVYALTAMCTIRLSFVKGWGADYSRPAITATPCWIEIHLNGPLRWLDRVLTKMSGPTKSIHSTT